MYARARVRREMGVEKVDFNDLVGLLVSHDHLPKFKAKLIAKSVRRSFCQPDCWRWLSGRPLNLDELLVVRALLDLQGADDLSLIRRGPENIRWFRPATEFTLHLSRERAGAVSVRGVLGLFIFGRELQIKTPLKAMVVMSIVAIWIALMAAVAWGLLLWGISTLAIFVYFPGSTIVAATREWQIGLGLLATFVGLAAIGGETLRRRYRRK